MPLLLLIFIILPLAELYVLIEIGQAIGLIPALAILLLDGFVGAWLARSQGRATWMRFNQAMAEGRVPGREVADGAMIILGGAFLLTPGFITDVFGIALLLPPTRALLRKFVLRAATRVHPAARATIWVGGRAGDYRRRERDTRPSDINGTAREIEPDQQVLPPSGEPTDPPRA